MTLRVRRVELGLMKGGEMDCMALMS